MKRVKFLTAASSLVMLVLFACHKEDSKEIDRTTKMVTDKTQVKPGETVSFAVQHAQAGLVSQWSVVPDTNVQVSRPISWDQRNTITFQDTGTYTVYVQLKKVPCDSIAMLRPGMDTCLNSGENAGNAHATIVVKN